MRAVGRDLLLAALLTGCAGPTAAFNRAIPRGGHWDGEMLTMRAPPDRGVEAVFSVDWRRELLTPEMLEWTPREMARPAVDDSGRLYVATRDGFVRCLDSDGELVWEYKSKGPFYGSLELDGDRLFVPSADGVLLSLNAPDGTLRWTYRAGEELGSRPVIANGLVYVASFADTVFAIDEETGAWKWQYRRESPAEFTIRGTATPAIDFDKLFMSFSDGTAVCLDASDGTLKWERKLSSVTQFPDADADPQLDGQGHVIFASFASGLFSLDEETGAIIWGQSTAGITALLADGDTVYATGQGLVTARAVDTGLEKWHYKLGDRYGSAPAIAGHFLLVPTTQALYFIDRRTGRVRRAFNPGRGISATPTFRAGELYVLSNYGYVYALALAPSGKGG